MTAARHPHANTAIMLPLACLLNPDPSPGPQPEPCQTPGIPSHRLPSHADQPVVLHRRLIDGRSMAKESKLISSSKPKGVINFYPFEEGLDEASLREIRKFHVEPLGEISKTCRRIPYNSGKKDFFRKTGRESFEVFQYDFRVPGADKPYTVMWDYNVGLVRMTPFFKCCKYSKTTPAKMLNVNPGLRDITHSITGGSIEAQGYWMPFACAKAVCATFCCSIAGALIPIFGPLFPSQCIPLEAPEKARMLISPEIVAQSRRDAADNLRIITKIGLLPSPTPSTRSSSPQSHSQERRPNSSQEMRLNKGLDVDSSPYFSATDTDIDHQEVRSRYVFGRGPPPLRNGPTSAASSMHTPGWTAVNQSSMVRHHYAQYAAAAPPRFPVGMPLSSDQNSRHETADPYLSAIPRTAAGSGRQQSHRQHFRQPLPTMRSRRYSTHNRNGSGSSIGSSDRLSQYSGQLQLSLHVHRRGKRSVSQLGDDDDDDDSYSRSFHDDEYDASESLSESSPTITMAAEDGNDEHLAGRAHHHRRILLPPLPPFATISPRLAQGLDRQTTTNSNEEDDSRSSDRVASEKDAAMALMHLRALNSQTRQADDGIEAARRQSRDQRTSKGGSISQDSAPTSPSRRVATAPRSSPSTVVGSAAVAVTSDADGEDDDTDIRSSYSRRRLKRRRTVSM